MKSLLIANRGEIAIRIARTAAEMGLRTVAVFSEDDARALHVAKADEAVPLAGVGANAYLDIEQILSVAARAGCDAVHPGYGFLSENPAFARACGERGITFVGPSIAVLESLGDKAQARRFAQAHGVPIIRGTAGGISASDSEKFLASLGTGRAMMLKAVSGGGGRGMRRIASVAEVRAAFARCQSEAQAAFGCAELYAEELLTDVRHIEVQILGDSSGRATHLGERECSLQRRQQKLVEIAPSPALSSATRGEITAAAVKLATALGYQGIGTFEFLVEAKSAGTPGWYFMEANPRLQVEHTVTEMTTGFDLVRMQLELATGKPLAELGLGDEPQPPRGAAMQLRINMETLDADGNTRPSGGTLTAFEPPAGPGVRVDTSGYVGNVPSANFDSLLAKLIVHSASDRFEDLVAKAYRALREFRIEGIATNRELLLNLLANDQVRINQVDTRFIENHLGELLQGAVAEHRPLFFAEAAQGQTANPSRAAQEFDDDVELVLAPMRGTVVQLAVAEGDLVASGQPVAVLDAMKMEHVVAAVQGGIVRQLLVEIGETVADGQPLAVIEPADAAQAQAGAREAIDLEHIRADLAEVQARQDFGSDASRPEKVAKRRAKGQRTARENIADLADPDSFIEYGALAVAAQRSRRTIDDLMQNTSGDGLLVGIASVNGAQFSAERARAMLVIGDYMVLAGTQGYFHHRKLDRAVEIAERWRIPLIVLPEGGGGRPGDVDPPKVSGLTTRSFANFAKLSGLVPIVSMVSGYCFAGSAVLPGCSDVIIATRDSSIGMAGPAMIEGGGLGVYAPEAVGPIGVQAANGVVDVVVDDEAEGCRVAKQYLSYFQGAISSWTAVEQRLLRHLIPENRIRSYDVRPVIRALADEGSVLELRAGFGLGMITALVRIEGQPVGLICNNPRHLGGAIDADAADKAARFMQLCNTFGLPIVSLCDTPGFMVGPEAEKTGLVRHVSRMFVTAAAMQVPFLTIVVRKAYGLGAQAMAGGSIHESMFSVAWPSGEFGPMGLEGAVRLGFRKELEAIVDPQARQAKFEEYVAQSYQRGKGLNVASYFEIDAVIDPADSRRWIMRALNSLPPRAAREKTRGFLDTW